MQDPFDKFVEALETMIDAQDEMFEEEKNCNYRHKLKIMEEKYNPARQDMREAFYEAVIKVLHDHPSFKKKLLKVNQ